MCMTIHVRPADHRCTGKHSREIKTRHRRYEIREAYRRLGMHSRVCKVKRPRKPRDQGDDQAGRGVVRGPYTSSYGVKFL